MNRINRFLSILLAAAMVGGWVPATAFAQEEQTSYRVSEDYAARYPNGVIALEEAQVSAAESGGVQEIRLIRRGGTEGGVSVELKAIDISAKYGEDYTVSVESRKLTQDEEYSGTMLENYLSEQGEDYITTDEILTDEAYRDIIGYDEPEQLTEEEREALRQESISMVSEQLDISAQQAESLITENSETEYPAAEDSVVEQLMEQTEEQPYASKLHQLKDSVLGKTTAANQVKAAEIVDQDALLGSNDANLAQTAINDAAVGASLVVRFDAGEAVKTIKIKIVDDDVYEAQELFVLGLCNPEGGAEIGDIFNASVIINDNDDAEACQIGFESGTISVDRSAQAATLKLIRSGNVNDYAQVNVFTVEDTATEGTDYLAVDGSSVFMPGETSKTVIVPLKTAETTLSGDVAFDVILESDTHNVTLNTAKARVTILAALAELPPPAEAEAVQSNAALAAYGAAPTPPPFELPIAKNYMGNTGVKGDLRTATAARITITRKKDIQHPLYSSPSDNQQYRLSILGSESELFTIRPGETKSIMVSFKDNGNYYFTYGKHSGCSDDTVITINIGKYDRIYSTKTRYGAETQYWFTIDKAEFYPAPFIIFGIANYRENGYQNKAEGVYRVFDGPEQILSTHTYDAGTVERLDQAYRGMKLDVKSYSPTDETYSRYARLDSYDLSNNDGNTVWWYKEIKDKPAGSELTIEDIRTLYTAGSIMNLTLKPIVRGKYADFIWINAYDRDCGVLKIGGKAYNSETLKSTQWREGDELKVTVESAVGYQCTKIRVLREGREYAPEYIAPGSNVKITKNMEVKPIFEKENITVQVDWSPLGTGLKEEKEQNLASYRLASDHSFTDHGNGSYTFYGMTPGDIVRLYAVPKNPDAPKDYSGLWLRTPVDESEIVKNNDVRYPLHMGDAYAFTVGEKDMKFKYYFNPKSGQSQGGTVVKGRVVTSGGTLKNPNTLQLTPSIIAAGGGIPVADASVSILSLDPNAEYFKNGHTYYTNCVTDREGSFSIFVPGGAEGLHYNVIVAAGGRVTQTSAPLTSDGTLVLELPFQNGNFQIDAMTLGTDMVTDKIEIGTSRIKLGLHLVCGDGYRAQFVKFRSYDANGMLLKEWSAENSTAEGWSYESSFVPKEVLKEDGKLTVEVYDEKGRGMGELDTGYTLVTKPVKSTLALPKFDPNASVTLPIIGDVSSSYDFGTYADVLPTDANNDKDETTLRSPVKSSKHAVEITFGSGKAIKNAIKAAKQSGGYEDMSAKERASNILSQVENDPTAIYESKTDKKNENKAAMVKGGKGKNAMTFGYDLGVYMGMYTQGGKFYLDSVTLFASLNVKADTTQQFTIVGIPLYLTFGGEVTGSSLLHMAPKNGGSLEMINPQSAGYFNPDMLVSLETAGVFHFLIKVKIGAGVGIPKMISAGIDGTLDMDIEYQPWKDGGGIASFGLNAVFSILGVDLKYNITSASYGMFKTPGYTGSLDFSKVKNSDRFKTANSQLLMSYDDGERLTTVTGSYERRERGGGSTWVSDGVALMAENEAGASPLRSQSRMEHTIDTLTPQLLPLRDQTAILFSLADDPERGANDCSALSYSIVDMDGNFSNSYFLDDDGTFDSNFTASQLSDGRILVVWSDLAKTYGDDDAVDLGEAMNQANLSYCIFDANGTPGEVRRLTDQPGCESLPRIAHDEATGRTLICYTATDYQTQGVGFGADHLDELGNFIYNSYSTVCFKVLDENGEMITSYTPAESAYAAYEAANGTSLDGVRFMNVQLADSQSQATIDEITTAAKDGKAYVVYSLDIDRDTATTEDRELFLVTYDLDSMEGTQPVRLTDNLMDDSNPQLLTYRENVLLYWNYSGVVATVNLTQEDEISSAIKHTTFLDDLDGAAETFYVTSQPDGNLYLFWSGWEPEAQAKGTGMRRAVYMTGYDPDFVYRDDEGREIGRGGHDDGV